MKRIVMLFSLIIFTSHVCAQESATKTNVLKVSIYESSPMIMVEEDDNKINYSGYDIELINEIANRLGYEINYNLVPNFSDIFSSVKDKTSDLAVAGVTINSTRESFVDFSHHYLDSGLRILVRDEKHNTGFWYTIKQILRFNFLKAFFKSMLSPQVLEGFLCLFVFNLIFAHIIWIIERGKNPEIQSTYLSGIFSAFYFSNVTTATVGYGDISAKRIVGRITTILLIWTGIAFFANITGLLSAKYTVEQLEYAINSPDDLKGKSVATIDGTTSVEALHRLGANVVAVNKDHEMYELLMNGDVDAVVYDSPNLLYYAKQNPEKVAIVGGLFDRQYYGIVFPSQSVHVEEFNKVLLSLSENGFFEELNKKYFGD